MMGSKEDNTTSGPAVCMQVSWNVDHLWHILSENQLCEDASIDLLIITSPACYLVCYVNFLTRFSVWHFGIFTTIQAKIVHVCTALEQVGWGWGLLCIWMQVDGGAKGWGWKESPESERSLGQLDSESNLNHALKRLEELWVRCSIDLVAWLYYTYFSRQMVFRHVYSFLRH